MGLIRLLLWFALFVVATFAFTVLFEHGPLNYVENAHKELEMLKKQYHTKLQPKADESDKLTR